MNYSIHLDLIKKNYLLKIAFLSIISTSSCAYRLTNLHLKTPEKISTIAIESVYDTGREVFPHEHLWDQLQRAFAANGHLKLADVKNSDALLRARIKQSSIVKSGSEESANSGADKSDPTLYVGKPNPPSPNVLPELKTARKFYPKDLLTYSVDVEVYEIATHKLLLQRSYAVSSEILASRNEPNSAIFIRHEESAERGVAKLAKQIAETVVSDLLVR